MQYTQSFLDVADQRLGLQIYPEPAPDAPVAAIWPAMGVPARYYRPMAERLDAEGLAVVVADLRGTGASTPRPSRRARYGYAELASDVGAVLDHARHGRFPWLAGVDVEAALGQVRTPVLAISLDGDRFTPAATVDLLASKFIDAPVRRVHLGPADMGRPVDHFTWVRASTPVASRIAQLARTAPEP